MGMDKSKKDAKSLLLNIYDFAFRGRGMEIFDSIAREIGVFFEANSCSLWINHPNIPKTETRIGYYQKNQRENLSQLDYKFIHPILSLQNSILEEAISGQAESWYYYIYSLKERDLTGGFALWFKEKHENEEFLDKISIELSKKLATLVNHFLSHNRFNTSEISEELFAAERIQKSLIPTEKPKISYATISFRNLSAGKVGGDYLDLIKLNGNRLGLAVGDAMGKGIPGAFIMLSTRAVFRMLAKANAAPEIAMRQLNICLTPELIKQGMFISLFYGVYNGNNQTLQYAAAGHNPPLLFRTSQRKLQILKEKGMVIGGVENAEYQSDLIKMEKGDILIIYTDGLTEAKNLNNKQLGVDGVVESILNYSAYDAEGICNSLVHTLMKHCNYKLQDDASFIVLKVE